VTGLLSAIVNRPEFEANHTPTPADMATKRDTFLSFVYLDAFMANKFYDALFYLMSWWLDTGADQIVINECYSVCAHFSSSGCLMFSNIMHNIFPKYYQRNC
jgi:hypothetical protein